MRKTECEIVIVGAGMVGQSLAYQLLERGISNKIIIIEKENLIGLHSSGRNSGVLHAGLYYKPGSLKAKVSVSGARRLKNYILENKLSINNCGKVIVPTEPYLDPQIDVLAERGTKNGAKVEFLDDKQLGEKIPHAKSSSGRGLWSPNTSVVKPKEVMESLQNDLIAKGVQFKMGYIISEVDQLSNKIRFTNGGELKYDYFFNCAGLQADRLAHKFEIGLDYILLPFKGLYWKIKAECPISISTNLYPVPDLKFPFLGVHFTPSADSKPEIFIGPTATPAWGRENYNFLDGLEPLMAIKNISILASQYIQNKGGFQKYVNEQAFQSFQPFLIKAAKKLIPSLKSEFIEPSNKVGIRAQLFNLKEGKLVDDFLCINGNNSTHVLNAISPAFTASFELGDLIIDRSKLFKS
tara:strand:+ start:1948 stop:3174 length:1227 start_codon:yes stop_codon:yes gene_type:complete